MDDDNHSSCAAAALPGEDDEQPPLVSTAPTTPPLPPEDTPPAADLPDYIEPSFNIRMLRRRLLDTKTTKRDKLRLLLGLHYEMRRLPPT